MYRDLKWLQNVISPNETWEEPEPFMNFSIGGLSFEHHKPAPVGSMALLEFRVGTRSATWKGTGRIVRCKLLSKEHSLYEIALQFESLSENAAEALSELTLSIQEAML